MERQDSRRAGAGTGEDSRPTFSELTDRQLLEEVAGGLRRIRPLLEAAERHPVIRALLRR